MQVTRWVLMGLIGLLVAGCASPMPTIAPTHTSVPTVAPTLGQTQGAALPPMPTGVPTATPPAPTATPVEAPGGVTITILYDNNEYDERLETAWGFSCLVELPPASGGWKRPSSSTPAATVPCCCATCVRWELAPKT